jgi:hypothetical protein
LGNIPDGVKLLPLKCQVGFLSLAGFDEGMSAQSLQFLNLFSGSVDTLLSAINSSTSMQSLMAMIRGNFKALKFLVFSYPVLPRPEFYEQQPKFVGLKMLIMNKTTFRSANEIAGFFSLFPTIKKFSATSFELDSTITAEEVKSATQQLVNLKHLFIAKSFGRMQHASFKNLKVLELQSFDAAEEIDWKEVVDNNPKLILLKVDIECNNDHLDFKALIKCSSPMRTLCISMQGEFKLTEDRLQTFKESQNILLMIPKSSLAMTEEKFNEIAGIFVDFIKLL